MFEQLDKLDTNLQYNIYVVRTPFQFINAYETLYHFKTTNNILVIIDNGTQNNKNQLTQLCEEKYWDTIVRFGDNGSSNFMFYVNLIKKFKKLKIENLFTSSGFNKMQQIIIANVDAKHVCLFDQGMRTSVTYQLFKNNKFNEFNLKKIRFYLFGLKTKINKQIDFFTMFDFEPLQQSNIIKNNYEFVKQKYDLDTKEIKNEIYVVGQILVKSNMVSQEQYFDYLDTIINKYKDCKIHYMMHRTEDKEYLIQNGYDKKMNLINSTKPGEIFFLELPYLPKAIIGNISALLLSLKYIYKDFNIISYRFDAKNFNANKEYTLAYEDMKKNGIQIINLGTNQ